MSTSALGKGLGSLIPQRKSVIEEILPETKSQVLDIPVEHIYPNPRQPRHHFSAADLEDLIQSIKEHGVLLPLVVTKKGEGYELIAGERRLRASKMLGNKTVPAIVREASEQQKLELALIENIQRQDLNAVEEAIAYRALIDEFSLTQEEVAKRVGKSRSSVANTLRLLDLSQEMRLALQEGKITKSHARTLLAEEDRVKRQRLFEEMLSSGMSVRMAEERVEKKQRTHSPSHQDPNIEDFEKRLRERFGTKVRIQEKKGRGRLTIEFYSREELMAILEQLS